MSSDKQISIFLSFSFPLCLGLVLGLLIFNPSEGLFLWWFSIDWGAQSIANAGAWVSGIATSIAAVATAFAARASARAAKAAQQSANNWRQQACYDKYIDVAVNARIKLRKYQSHVDGICKPIPHIFPQSSQSIVFERSSNDASALVNCIINGFEKPDSNEANRFNKFSERIKFHAGKIGALQEDVISLVERAFELSKSHVGITEKEVNALRREIDELFSQVAFMSKFYERTFESPNLSDENLKGQITSCLNCGSSHQHYYLSICSTTNLLFGYLDHLVISPDRKEWERAKSQHISSEQHILRLISNQQSELYEMLVDSLAHKF